MVDPNITIGLLTPVATSIEWVISALKVLLGGMFGLYLILVLLKWKETRDLKLLIREVSKDVKEMKETIADMKLISKKKR